MDISIGNYRLADTKCDIIKCGMAYCSVGASGQVSHVHRSEDAGESVSIYRTPETVWSRSADAPFKETEGP